MWLACFALSVLIVIGGVLHIVSMSRNLEQRKPGMTPINIMIISIFFASTAIFLPIYLEMFADEGIVSKCFKALLVSMHHAIRLFILDSEFDFIKEMVPDGNGILYNIYSCYVALLFLGAPILTFGVVLSLFKNISAYRKYIMGYRKKAYIFSELNDKSIALANSIRKKHRSSIIVFTDVYDKEENQNFELQEKADKISALCFKKDILAINFGIHSPTKKIAFFIMGDNETENLKQAQGIISKYNKRANTQLYVFSNDIEGELLLNTIPEGQLRVRRISDVRAMIHAILQHYGEYLFKEAVVHKDSGKKLISAVVVGMGRHGGEMVRTLAWFGQMEGYRIEIDSFDKCKDIEQYFTATCPELMDESHNNIFNDNGEAQYKITIHSGVDTGTVSFNEQIEKISNATYIFISLGDDEKNIRTAVELRILFEKMGVSPRIQALLKNTDRRNSLQGITNYSGQAYNIDFVGDVENFYSVGGVIDSDLEKEALQRHMRWGNEDDFWKYEYNYRSSIASALHRRMKIACKVPGIEKTPAERSAVEKHNLQVMEHRRWNAYMRSEGYTYSETRNNLAKTHNCLVTFDKLSQKDKEKDDD